MRSSIFLLFAAASALPGFAGLTYTCDPNIDAARAGTCAYLNSTIAGLYNSTFSNVNANIYIQYGVTDLGQSKQGFDNQVTYSAYLAALTASAQASGNAVQIAAVKALNSLDTALYGNGYVDISSALGTALGFPNMYGTSADGNTPCAAPGTAPCYNGIITITNDTQNTPLYYRTGGSEPQDAYDFYATVEHETNEVLGTSSCIDTTGRSLSDGCPRTNTPAAVDLFRYQSAGTPVLINNAPVAYFSYDGGQTNGAGTNKPVYNTLSNGEDYADFVSGCPTVQEIQDVSGCPGYDAGLDITNDGGAEINILNAIGYRVNAQPATPPTITSVVNAATFQATIAANTYVTIKGQGLSTTAAGRTWTSADFTTKSDGTLKMPTSLDGTSVTVGGVPAYVEYVSPTQLNIITPALTATGSGIPVVVSLNGQASAAFPVTLQQLAPSFFA